MLYVALLLCFACSILFAAIVKKVAMANGATDKSNYKINQNIIPSLGGLIIFISFMVGMSVVSPDSFRTLPVMVGATIIAITGVLAERFQLSSKWKLMGQTIATLVVAVWGGVQFSYIYTFSGNVIEFGYLAIPLTVLWIIGITNAVNLTDALDDLSIGISTIALMTISLMAYLAGNSFVASIGGVLLVSTLGFMLYSSFSIKILIGNTGSLFLGFMIAVLTLSGLKNVTMIYIPTYILGVPIVLHYYFLQRGFTYKQTVSICCSIAALFSLAAFIFSASILWVAIIALTILLVSTQIFSKYRFV